MPTAQPASVAAAPTSQLARWLLLVGVGISVAFVFITKNTYDTGDSIQHYLFARYALQHPLNLLHSWAKPLFTLLATGPAQLGFRGMMLFQCAVVAASVWLSYRTARGLGLPYAGLAILFCYAAPDYFHIQFSGLTEPLFGLVLIGSVALAVAGQPVWSAALVSWLPFVRSEGFVLLGVWVLCLVWQRQWRALPWLGLGYLLYSGVGALVLGKPGWVLGRNPYPVVSPYGHGGWDQYVVGLLYLLGWGIAVLVLLGGAQMARLATRPAAWAQPLFRTELLLVYGTCGLFVAMHTVFWAKGIFASAGLTRVLAGLTPLLALVALRGLAGLASLARTPVARRRLVVGVGVVVVAFLFTGLHMSLRWQRDFGQPGDLALAEQAAAWYRQLPAHARPVAVEHPGIAHALALDIFDRQRRPLATVDGQPALAQLPVGTLLFWDDWFSTIEGHLPLEMLQANPQFRQRWAGTALRQANDPGSGTTQVIVFEKIR